MQVNHLILACLGLVLAGLSSGCSIKPVKRLAMRQMANALAGTSSTFSSDEDPELVREALPFGLKMMEAVLAETPRHEALLLTTCKSFTQYTYGFVQQEADRIEADDFERAEAIRSRAAKLYLRARDYGLRALDVRHAGLSERLLKGDTGILDSTKAGEAAQLYWTAVSWAAAIALSKDNADMIAEMPLVEALIDRALQLDEGFDSGAIHSFLITFELSRQGAAGDPFERARAHFRRAVELSNGTQAAPYVALAEGVAVETQDKRQFVELLKEALSIDPDTHPETRLANLITQKRARWLLSRTGDLFLE